MRRLIAVLLAAACTTVGAQAADIAKSFETALAVGLNGGDVYRRYTKLDLEYTDVFDTTLLKAVLRAEEDTLRPVDPRRVYLREAYVSHDIYGVCGLDSISLKAGSIIHTWGNADEIKPVDVLNPQDLTFLLFKPIQERKYGVFSYDVTLYATPDLFLELVEIPEFRGNDTESSVFVTDRLRGIRNDPRSTLLDPVAPGGRTNAMSHAARIGFMVRDVDAHLLYYNGYDHMPVLEAEASAEGSLVTFTPVYRRVEMYGIDFQRALFSGIAVRGEAAYFPEGKCFALSTADDGTALSPFAAELAGGGDGLRERPYLEYTAGFDARGFPVEDLYVNLQLNTKHILDHVPEIADDAVNNSLLGTVEYTFAGDKAKLRLRGFYNVNDKASATQAETMLRISGNLELGAGVWLVSGDRTTWYGQFSRNDFAYLTTRALF